MVGRRRRRLIKKNIVNDESRSDATGIPKELLMEILVRLPVVSLLRFKCVSRFWSSLISSRYFTNLFFKFSSSTTRERRVFMYVTNMEDSMLFSSSLSNFNAAAASSFPQLNHDLTLPHMEVGLRFVNALRGLICFTARGGAIRIINFTTRQVLSLPPDMLLDRVYSKSENLRYFIFTKRRYFGYDPVNDEYKVLTAVCSFSKKNWWRVRSETQVLVLGAGASWRNTKSRTSPHCPHKGISINGILYYGAWSHERRCVLISFDWNYEEFNQIEFPIELRSCLGLFNLMNYQGKVAVFDCSRLGILDLWVFEDAGMSKWSHKVFVLPGDQLKLIDLDISYLQISGTSRSGEIILSRRHVNENEKTTHAIYDLERNRITRAVVIEPRITRAVVIDPLCRRFSAPGFLETALWDDVENIMYLEA